MESDSLRRRPSRARKGKAVALRYRPDEQQSPVVLGKGEGTIADRILEVAQLHDIPIRQDPDLVEVLSQLDLNTEIPRHVYLAVAEILNFVYQSSRGYRREMAESYLRLGDQRQAQGDNSGALRSWQTARDIFLDLGEQELAGRAELRMRIS